VRFLYALCALAFVGGVIAGCSSNAKADSPAFGEYLGTTTTGSMVSRFQDNATICYVARADRGLVSPPAISCVRQ
jgi:hypothetical protein